MLKSKQIMKKTTVLKAQQRGFADHGWLRSYHTFSFGSYYHPEHMQFGALRVLNDDEVAAGRGFGQHPHANMEIVSIPLEGDLEHQDSMGNTAVIKAGDVQVMSAGTGVYHSEYNHSQKEPVKFLQIWVIPDKMNVKPRYDQLTLPKKTVPNTWQQIVGPEGSTEGLWIHQKAWFHIGRIEKEGTLPFHPMGEKTGLFIFQLEGSSKIEAEHLERRDSLKIPVAGPVTIEAMEESRILLIEVAMDF